MTKEEKELVLKDLCARLPYGVKINHQGYIQELTVIVLEDIIYSGHEIKPYLRSLPSMTEEERKEYLAECDKDDEDSVTTPRYHDIDWLNEHHFDYRGLIPMSLALPATKGMYNITVK